MTTPPASVTEQEYKDHHIRIEYYAQNANKIASARVIVDGEVITCIAAPASPLDWAHEYIDKHVKLEAAKVK